MDKESISNEFSDRLDGIPDRLDKIELVIRAFDNIKVMPRPKWTESLMERLIMLSDLYYIFKKIEWDEKEYSFKSKAIEVIKKFDNLYNSLIILDLSKVTDNNFLAVNNRHKSELSKLNSAETELKMIQSFFKFDHLKENIIKYESVKNKVDELDNILKTARESVGGIALESSARFYDTEANNYKDMADKWFIGLIFTMFLSVLTVVAIFSEFNDPFSDTSSGTIMIRIFIGIIAFYILNTCSRNFKSSKHNYVINKHRSQSLKTFRAFAEYGKEQPEISTPILREAAKTIFDHQPTGFGGQNIESDNSINITELVKSFKPSS